MASRTAGIWPQTDLSEAAELLDRREVSARELVAMHLERIERLDPTLHACVTVTAEQAMVDAASADETRARRRADASPLLGIPIAIKDNFETAGVRTTAGSPSLSGYVPDEDAVSISRLRSAGAVIVAKVNMDELALGGTSDNLVGGATLNPWDAESIPGGSSGGSGAAVAAGMCAAATGSDTGGSIRNPTAWCGVSGLKPTFGAIDPKGIVPLAWSLDTVGFLAHTVLDCAQLFAEVADSMQERPPSERRSFVQHVKSQPTRRPRVLVARNVIELSEPEVRGSFHDAVEALNGVAQVEEIDLPRLDDSLLALMTIIISEGAAAWEAALRAGWDRFGPPVRALLDVGRAIRATEYLHAQRIREGIRREMLQLFEPHDALFMPTMGIAPRPNVFENADVVLDSPMWHLEGKFTGMWSLTGFPVLSIPCAFTDARRPIAMQIVGAPWSEVSLLQVGMIAEAAWSIPRLSLEPTWVRSQVSGDAAA